jgi:hypothetical protein
LTTREYDVDAVNNLFLVLGGLGSRQLITGVRVGVKHPLEQWYERVDVAAHLHASFA